MAIASLAVLALVGSVSPALSASAAPTASLHVTVAGDETGMDLGHVSTRYTVSVYPDADRSAAVGSSTVWLDEAPSTVIQLTPGDYVYCIAPTEPTAQPYALWCSGDTSSIDTAVPLTLVSGVTNENVELPVRDGYAGPQLFTTSGPELVENGGVSGYPTFTGAPSLGSILHAARAEWWSAADGPETGVVETVRWARDGRPISGATARLYAVTTHDINHELALETHGTAVDRASSEWTQVWSSPVSRIPINVAQQATATVTRSDEKHYTFSVARVPAYSSAGVAVQYSWTIDGKRVATGPKLSTTQLGEVRLWTTGTKSDIYSTAKGVTLVRKTIAPPEVWRAATEYSTAAPRVGRPLSAMVSWLYSAQRPRISEPDYLTYTWQYARDGGWVTFSTQRQSGRASSSATMPAASRGHSVRLVTRAFSSATVHGTDIHLFTARVSG